MFQRVKSRRCAIRVRAVACAALALAVSACGQKYHFLYAYDLPTPPAVTTPQQASAVPVQDLSNPAPHITVQAATASSTPEIRIRRDNVPAAPVTAAPINPPAPITPVSAPPVKASVPATIVTPPPAAVPIAAPVPAPVVAPPVGSPSFAATPVNRPVPAAPTVATPVIVTRAPPAGYVSPNSAAPISMPNAVVTAPAQSAIQPTGTQDFGESCESVAKRRQTDSSFSGFDANVQQQVYKNALAECQAWHQRSSTPR